MKVYQMLSQIIDVLQIESKHRVKKWEEMYEDDLKEIVDNYLPSGSGFDRSFRINMEKSKRDKIYFDFSYHCMNDDGYYDGWITVTGKITPSLIYGMNLKLNWHGYNGKYKFLLDDYFYDVLDQYLNKEYERKLPKFE
jgi:hypothetical protein